MKSTLGIIGYLTIITIVSIAIIITFPISLLPLILMSSRTTHEKDMIEEGWRREKCRH